MIKSVKSSFISLDVKICRSIYQYSEKYYVDRLMYYFSKSADGVWYFFLGLFIVLYNFKIGTKFSLIVLIAFVLEIALQKLIKLFVKRERPGWVIDGISFLINPPDKFSFPSGHTAGAFLISTAFVFFFPEISPLFIFWAFFVGISRIYNGVHYPSDVLAGAFLGVFSFYTILKIYLLLFLSPFI